MELLDILLAIARVALAVTFIVSGVAKLFDIPGSQKGVQNFGIPESLAKPLGILVPIAELILAVMLIPVRTTTVAALGLLALLVVFTAGISMNLARGKKESCHCFGQLSNEPIGKHSLVRNGILSALALFVGVSGLMGNPGPSLVAWTEDLSMFQWVLLALLIIIGLVLAGVVWLLVHLLGQNGRLLVRMDALEEALANADIDVDDDDDEDDEDEEDEDEGLPIGAPAPAFSLTGLYGETSTLESLTARGKPVMLIFSDPGCGPCNSLMPDVGKWQKELGDKLTVSLVSRGDLESNRQKANQHSLQNVLMQKDNEVADDYRTFGTPTGVLVWPDGLIASGAAGGGGAIKKVVDDVVAGKIAAPKRIDPSALQLKAPSRELAGSENIGSPAPSISLQDLDGNTVTLEQYKGKDTALLFWNPGCGFCKRMEDDLKAWEANKPANAPELLIVSTGSVEDNRAHGFNSRTILDSGFNTGRAFGASGTPSAVMVGADGSLKSGVAVGAPSVLGLLRNELPAPAPAAPRGRGGNGGGGDAGPKVGAAAPAVELKDLDGKTVKLSDFRGEPTALLFWNPGCGFCKRMEDDLKNWERNKPAGAPKLLIVSTGDADSNRAHGFQSPIVLDAGFNTGRAFGASGTPSAVLVGADGSVASSVAVGAPGVLGMLRGEAVAEAPAEPAAPSIGDKAPVVRLPDLNGNMVDLADNAGSRTLVLFWNPGCGFCKRMLDDLKAWEANPQPGAPKLLVVSTGSTEDNRALGLQSPVVLDGNFSVGNAFGSNGTPSAILVDGNGKVASALAVGGPNVMELAHSVE